MDRATFQENYNLSRGQVDRLLAKARQNKGRFELPECGLFTVRKKGNGKTAPVDITPVRNSAPVTVAAPPAPPILPGTESVKIPPDLEALDKANLDRLLVAANILKVRQSTESERRRIRAEVLSELVTAVSLALSDVRRTIDDLRLPADQLDKLRDTMSKALEKLDGVHLDRD